MDLSILDFGHLGNAVALAEQADRLGFRRYWLGEHHSRWQCANPLLLGALLAATGGGIRIGSGGVGLGYHSPYRIAEDARLIEFLIPGRFDLGVTRGMPLPGELLEVLRDRRPEDSQSHLERLADLHGYLTGRLPAGHPLQDHPLPLEPGPPLWVLGISRESARWAGLHGTGFCFSLHHAPEDQDGPGVLEEYRRCFKSSPEFPEPAAIVVASLACRARPAGSPRATVEGSVAECWERLEETAHRFGVEELMILDLIQSARWEPVEDYPEFAELASLAGLPPRSR